MKKNLLVILWLSFAVSAFSQYHYLVFFTDKAGVSFNPYDYFDRKAIERRRKLQIPICEEEETDLPLKQAYVDTVTLIADSVRYHLRWFNALEVWASFSDIEKIKSLFFVKEIMPVISSDKQIASYKFELDSLKNNLLSKQLDVMGGNMFVNRNITGKGVRIAVFDAGFPTVDTSPVFEHLRKNRQIIKTWDFVRNCKNVYDRNQHGLMTLSCIAGMVKDKYIGLATGAEFLLARTETWTEPFSEELNWLAAVEWADKNGADIISSSLGYTDNRYFKKDMDGMTALVTRAGNLAARKGILVVNAIGNDGDDKWRIMGAPADADSVLTVGGVQPFYNYHISFSALGPTSDGRIKPNVVAYGEAIVAGKNKMKNVFGTSFATPFVAGFAACVWQLDTTMTNMELFDEIEKSGNLYPYFDYAHGYGIPQAAYFLKTKNKRHKKTFYVANVLFPLKIIIEEPIDMGRKDNNLFYKYLNEKGEIISYYVMEICSKKIILYPPSEKVAWIELFYHGTYERVRLRF